MQASHPKHILTIDDESGIREILREVLVASGYRVTGADSEEEAMRIIRSDPPDLIITDLQLEEADGFALIAHAKAVVPKTPIILLTGMLFDPAVALGPVGDMIAAYLQKTVPLERVLKEVKHHLGD